MFPNKIDSRYVKSTDKRICQGDILRDINILDNYSIDKSGELEYDELNLLYIIVMTQDCDLEGDFKNRSQTAPEKHDKFLRTILICPAYIASYFRGGKHLDGLGLKMEPWNSKNFHQIKDQNKDRFHFLDQDQELQIPEMVIDFKHYYAIPRNTLYGLYNEHYLATINQLFREFLSQRFANYLSRIGLPQIHEGKIDCKEMDNSDGTSKE
jgi:hypothetical protein